MSDGKRKNNDKNTSSRFCFKRKKTRNTHVETNQTIVDRKPVCQELLNKLEPCVEVEDEKVLQVFRYHAISKCDENTVRSLLKFKKKGLIRN